MAAISLTSRLSTVARRVLAQPVCGCARLPRSVIGLSTDRSKPLRARAWATPLVTSWCSCMSPCTHMQLKLQTAAYRQPGEKWDSDSDSDKSDDENDFKL